MQQVSPALHDPAPSRASYRIQRLLLTPGVKFILRVFLPFLLALGFAAAWLSDQERRDKLNLYISDLRTSIEMRPEFLVKVMAIDGAGVDVAEDIREIVPIDFPISSFDLELEDIRKVIAGLDPVAEASVRIRPGGVLQVDVVERTPAILWRTADGLVLLDQVGIYVGPADTRTTHPDLPLIAGTSGDNAVSEALKLFATAGPLAPRLRGMVRVSERRWDVILDRDQRILLPEFGAVEAFERVVALSQAQDILDRDIMALDMRVPQRPTVRLADQAVKNRWQMQQISIGDQ